MTDTHHPSLLPTYAAPPFDAERGEGVYLHDTEGRKYLDFSAGIAVLSVGHSHPRWVAAVREQAGVLAHCSNLYGIPGQKRLADRLLGYTGPGRCFFCNSGAEANEALIKFARLYGRAQAPPAADDGGGTEAPRHTVVAAANAFHGRTFGGMAATPQDKIQGGFHPMLEGFRFGELNDIASFDALVDDGVAAVFLETIQGEGGVYPAAPAFLRELRALCDEREALLILDEVQCGVGRTGTFFAFEPSGVRPDAIGMAKGLGGGFPIGAIWVAEPHADLFRPGSHGTTFGGSPLAAAAANAVLDIIESENLLQHVASLSQPWHTDLGALARKHGRHLETVRGGGFMVGLGLRGESAPDVARAAREKGLLLAPAGPRTVRLLPPLIADAEALAESVRILDAVFTEMA